EIHIDPDKIYEEAGQIYKGKFWLEASKAGFMKCLDTYKGGIHLVYGEHDKYVSQENRTKVITRVKAKNQPVMVLPGQDHSPWDFDMAQEVYQEELTFLKKYL